MTDLESESLPLNILRHTARPTYDACRICPRHSVDATMNSAAAVLCSFTCRTLHPLIELS